ncbi:MAG: hypothetical protein IH609_18850 [Dehalococcoidia bacterium]|nr:hypothetical protein [Dehalococcoidia bacterium]
MLGAKPASTFPAWDGKSTVIYDVQTGKTLDLGPGSQPASFSPDGTKAAWAAGGDFAQGTEVFVIDLPAGQPRSLGPGRTAQFLDNSSLVVFAVGGNDRTIIDVATGAKRPYANERLGPSLGHFRWTAPEGYRLDPSDVTSPGTVRTFSLYNAQTGDSVLTFEAMSVAAAGPDELAVAAPPVDGLSNIYIVEIATGKATFIATAKPGRDNWPFSATADAVVWTDEFCSLDPGPVTLFDRKSGQLVRIAAGGGDGGRWMLLTRGGLLASGAFGADALIDSQTLEYVSVIPNGPDISWSADYRYASHGPSGGHGGLCGPG